MGKKVVRLTESDLVRIVEKVVSEQSPMGSLGHEIDKYNPEENIESFLDDIIGVLSQNSKFLGGPLLFPFMDAIKTTTVKDVLKKEMEKMPPPAPTPGMD